MEVVGESFRHKTKTIYMTIHQQFYVIIPFKTCFMKQNFMSDSVVLVRSILTRQSIQPNRG